MLITSKYESYCKGCRAHLSVGDTVGWQPGEKGVWCASCTPTAVKDTPARASAKQDYAEPWIGALAALEEAIVAQAARIPARAVEMERAWSKYQKLKALALAPGTAAEGKLALRQAILEAVKLAFDNS